MRQIMMVLLLMVGGLCGLVCVYDLSQSDPLSTIQALVALVGFVVTVGAGYIGSCVNELTARVAPAPVPMPYPMPQQGQP